MRVAVIGDVPGKEGWDSTMTQGCCWWNFRCRGTVRDETREGDWIQAFTCCRCTFTSELIKEADYSPSPFYLLQRCPRLVHTVPSKVQPWLGRCVYLEQGVGSAVTSRDLPDLEQQLASTRARSDWLIGLNPGLFFNEVGSVRSCPAT